MSAQLKTLESLGIKKLSKTEQDFMEVIWEHPDGIKSEELYAKFDQALGTKSTILYRIVRKGLATTVRDGRHYIYIPKITQEEYNQAFFQDKLSREFGITSFEGLAAAFCGRTKLRPEEKERISQLLEELKDHE